MYSFGESIGRFYKNYVNFSGRATRSEYWWVLLFQVTVYVALVITFIMLAGNDIYNDSDDIPASAWLLMLSGLVFALLNILPNWALGARRFHDLGQTGWLVLVFAVVNFFIGVAFIAQMIWFAMKGEDGPNQYGPDPLQPTADIFG